jgi:hypothetical protein
MMWDIDNNKMKHTLHFWPITHWGEKKAKYVEKKDIDMCTFLHVTINYDSVNYY